MIGFIGSYFPELVCVLMGVFAIGLLSISLIDNLSPGDSGQR